MKSWIWVTLIGAAALGCGNKKAEQAVVDRLQCEALQSKGQLEEALAACRRAASGDPAGDTGKSAARVASDIEARMAKARLLREQAAQHEASAAEFEKMAKAQGEQIKANQEYLACIQANRKDCKKPE